MHIAELKHYTLNGFVLNISVKIGGARDEVRMAKFLELLENDKSQSWVHRGFILLFLFMFENYSFQHVCKFHLNFS